MAADPSSIDLVNAPESSQGASIQRLNTDGTHDYLGGNTNTQMGYANMAMQAGQGIKRAFGAKN